MKRFKVTISNLLSRLCAAGVTLLGFNSCANDEVMYGQPYGTFEVKGSVTESNGNSAVDAEIRVTFPEAPSGVYSLASTSTDDNGDYELQAHDFLPEVKVVCIPDDTSLEADSVVVGMKYHKDANDKDYWYVGSARKTVDFKLKKKSKE